jgi:hypothetical protein
MKLLSDSQISEFRQSFNISFKSVDLNAMRFARVYDDGFAFQICTDERISRYIADNENHIVAHIPLNILQNRFWYCVPSSGKYEAILHDYKNLFDVRSVFNYVERSKGYIDLFAFLSKDSPENSTTPILNRRDYLESNISNFYSSHEAFL